MDRARKTLDLLFRLYFQLHNDRRLLANHHHIFHVYKRSDHYFVLLNVLFLMCISFLPFPTAVLAEYIADPEHRQPR